MKHISNERGAVSILAVTLVVLVAVAVGLAVYNANKAHPRLPKVVSAPPSVASSPSPSPAPTSPPKTHIAGTGEVYTSKQEGIIFSVPAGWTVKEDYPDAAYDIVEIMSPGGLRLWWNSESGGLGGSCDPNANPHVFIHAVTPVPGVQGAYVVEAGPQGSTTNVGVVNTGLVNNKPGGIPKVGDTGACSYYTTFKSRDGKRDMWLSAPDVAVAHVQSRKALTSEEISAVKTAMLSLAYK